MYHILRARIQRVSSDESKDGSNLTMFFFFFFFFFDEGREDPKSTTSGPSLSRQRKAIKWRYAGVPMVAQH